MSAARDIQLRQLILNEHRQGNDERLAHQHICAHLGSSRAVTYSKIRYWYGRFSGGDISVFNKTSYFHRSKNSSQLNDDFKQVKGLFMQFKDKRLKNLMTTIDGRIFIFLKEYSVNAKGQFVLLDLYHGILKPLTISDKWNKKKARLYRRIELVDSQHFLSLEFMSARLTLFKLNMLECKVEALCSIEVGEFMYGDFIVDSSDKRRFVLTLNNTFRLGHLKEDKEIILESIREMDLEGYDFKELKGRQLFDLRNVKKIEEKLECEFCTYDLNEMDLHSRKLAMTLPNGEPVNDIQGNCYAWLENSIYVVSKMESDEFKGSVYYLQSQITLTLVIKLNITNQLWSDTNIRVKDPISETVY
ncbi:hypothetical protein M3Y97_00310000 [Aphelenchoides bicaudatus]|nr:hypothetical protein M3Y97_00310000 [Aphelenchoides bicaudatus]